MNTLNIFALTRIKDADVFVLCEKLLSHRSLILKENFSEQESLRIFVEELIKSDVDPYKYNGFYYNFSIPQISKEFDLIKIEKNRNFILDVELKSEIKPKDELKKQLKRNKYYLRHVTDQTLLYTFVTSSKTCYILDDEDEIHECPFSQLSDVIKSFDDFYDKKIEDLFDPTQFLVSPINNPQKFIDKQYFLTSQQEEIKNNIIKDAQENNFSVVAIEGEAGTGKTLLLYDIATYCANIGRTCVIHCGILSNGHEILNNTIGNLNIIPISEVKDSFDFNPYRFLFIDETQRIYPKQLECIEKAIETNHIFAVFFLDAAQYLSKSELDHLPKDNIIAFCNKSYKLSGKIRTNKDMASFIKNVFDLSRKNSACSYDDVDILYVNNANELQVLLKSFTDMDYTFINYTPSNYKSVYFDKFESLSELNAHKVLGQEFDNIVLFIGTEFYYQENYLYSYEHPCPNYLYHKMLFQIMTRVRKKLCIIVLNNKDVFQKLLSIKQQNN